MANKQLPPRVSAIIQRIREFVDYKEIPHTTLDSQANLTKGYANRIFNNNHAPNLHTLLKMIDSIPEASPAWLLHGTGTIAREGHELDYSPHTLHAEALKNGRIEALRQYDLAPDHEKTRLYERVVTQNITLLTENNRMTHETIELQRKNNELWQLVIDLRQQVAAL